MIAKNKRNSSSWMMKKYIIPITQTYLFMNKILQRFKHQLLFFWERCVIVQYISLKSSRGYGNNFRGEEYGKSSTLYMNIENKLFLGNNNYI